MLGSTRKVQSLGLRACAPSLLGLSPHMLPAGFDLASLSEPSGPAVSRKKSHRNVAEHQDSCQAGTGHSFHVVSQKTPSLQHTSGTLQGLSATGKQPDPRWPSLAVCISTHSCSPTYADTHICTHISTYGHTCTYVYLLIIDMHVP